MGFDKKDSGKMRKPLARPWVIKAAYIMATTFPYGASDKYLARYYLRGELSEVVPVDGEPVDIDLPAERPALKAVVYLPSANILNRRAARRSKG